MVCLIFNDGFFVVVVVGAVVQAWSRRFQGFRNIWCVQDFGIWKHLVPLCQGLGDPAGTEIIDLRRIRVSVA